jgi:hypothetical protein
MWRPRDHPKRRKARIVTFTEAGTSTTRSTAAYRVHIVLRTISTSVDGQGRRNLLTRL